MELHTPQKVTHQIECFKPTISRGENQRCLRNETTNKKMVFKTKNETSVHMRLVLLQKSAVDVSAFWCNKDPAIYTPEN